MKDETKLKESKDDVIEVEAVVKDSEEATSDLLNADARETVKEPKEKKPLPWKWLGVVATVAVLIAGGWQYKQYQQAQNAKFVQQQTETALSGRVEALESTPMIDETARSEVALLKEQLSAARLELSQLKTQIESLPKTPSTTEVVAATEDVDVALMQTRLDAITRARQALKSVALPVPKVESKPIENPTIEERTHAIMERLSGLIKVRTVENNSGEYVSFDSRQQAVTMLQMRLESLRLAVFMPESLYQAELSEVQRVLSGFDWAQPVAEALKP